MIKAQSPSVGEAAAGSPAALPSQASGLPPLLLQRAGAITLLLGAGLAIAWFASLRNALLFWVGAGLGLSLLLGNLGFTGSWRAFIVHRRTPGLLATLLTLALASAVFIPSLANLDNTVGNLAPVGLSVLLGAFVFGIGMQLGGGCGSGTLALAGGGSAHSSLALIAFLPGSLLGTWHLPWFLDLPNIGVVSTVDALGVTSAIIAQIMAFAGLAFLALRAARRKQGASMASLLPSKRQVIGCVLLVAAAWLVLFISGRMWSITFGLALWSAKLGDIIGLPVSEMTFWQYPLPAEALASSVLASTVSVTNLGIISAAAALALWSANNSPLKLGSKAVAAALLGGLLMGYGARLAFGCNIGALFSGSASGSLHAWLWFASAWAGTHVGIGLRPRFGLSNK